MSQYCIHCGAQRSPDNGGICAMGGYCEWASLNEGSEANSDTETRRARLGLKAKPIERAACMWLPFPAPYPPSLAGAMLSLSIQPDLPFKPVGLMFWDLPQDAILEQVRVCNQEAVIAGHGRLPAKAFARAESYESLKKRVEDGEELFSEWLDAPPIYPYNRAYIVLSSEQVTLGNGTWEFTRAAFWGHAMHNYV